MKIWTKVALLAGVVVLAGTAGGAVAVAVAGQNAPVGPTPSGGSKLLGNGITETGFTPIVPCRILDTRKGIGKLPINATRTIDVRGSETTFTTQGGNPGGCGIPNGATAIEATITAVDSGSGFLRAWPAGLTQPNATFLNYEEDSNANNTGAITICGYSPNPCVANKDLDLRPYGTSTHLVVDVQGYYVPPMAANVTSAGVLGRNSRATAATKSATGTYYVTFDRNVSQCTYFAGTATTNAGASVGFASVTNRSGDPNGVSVVTYNNDGVITDRGFQVQVVC